MRATRRRADILELGRALVEVADPRRATLVLGGLRNQPKVSALAKYRLEGFSVERLMQFLRYCTKVEIVIRNKLRSRRPGRVYITLPDNHLPITGIPEFLII